MSSENAAEARAGFLDSVKGRAKEVVGAVSGKDDLVEEGQLQQAGARNCKAALANEAVADAMSEAAALKMRDANREAVEQARATRARAESDKSAVEREREHEHTAAATEAAKQEASDRESAERRADELA